MSLSLEPVAMSPPFMVRAHNAPLCPTRRPQCMNLGGGGGREGGREGGGGGGGEAVRYNNNNNSSLMVA